MSPSVTPVRVLISHSPSGTPDLEYANRFNRDLKANGIATFKAPEDIPYSDRWDSELEKLFYEKKISHLLAIISHTSMREKSYVRSEIVMAIRLDIPIIPVKIDDCNDSIHLVRIQGDSLTDPSRYPSFLSSIINQITGPPAPIAIYPIKPAKKTKIPSKEQLDAAHANASHIRVVAGPGTGKSFVIEERVRYLLSQGVSPDAICIVSFTRALTTDLRSRIVDYCLSRGQANAHMVHVSTLHSLAWQLLRKHVSLSAYPLPPKVLDSWEVSKLFNKEFSSESEIAVKRAKEIREAHEAFWATDNWDFALEQIGVEPITHEERAKFNEFHARAKVVYSYVLPGEIIYKALESIRSNEISPSNDFPLKHLIVDEFQDLNSVDQQFANSFTPEHFMVLGDDDQSIYSFRYASPDGIQDFCDANSGAVSYSLSLCYRCAPDIIRRAGQLIGTAGIPKRIVKSLTSPSEWQTLPSGGWRRFWRFTTAEKEARSIAVSCQRLHEAGIALSDILVLYGHAVDAKPLEEELDKVGLSYIRPTRGLYAHNKSLDGGRFVYTLVRLALDTNLTDAVAHWTLLGLLKGVGVTATKEAAAFAAYNSTSYVDLFYRATLVGLSTKTVSAIKRARAICRTVSDWKADDTVGQYKHTISKLLEEQLPLEVSAWEEYCQSLPDNMTISELFELLASETDAEIAAVQNAVAERLGLPNSPTEKIRISTVHSAKGLDAKVVFIPAFDEHVYSARKRGMQVKAFETVRLIYVAYTRAKAACVVSFATRRIRQGGSHTYKSSPYGIQLGAFWTDRTDPIQTTEVTEICSLIDAMDATLKST